MVDFLGKLKEAAEASADAGRDFFVSTQVAPIRDLPATEQYAALKNVMGEKAPDLFNKLDGVPPELQQSFAHAYVNNASFRNYLAEGAQNAVEGAPNLANAVFDDLYQTDKNGIRVTATVDGEKQDVFDPLKVNAVQGILTTIGNDPTYDMEKIDNAVDVINEGKNLTAAAKADGTITTAEQEALDANRKLMIRIMRDAGADIPALANFDMSMFMDFMETLMEDGFDAAISGLITDLDIEGTPQAESLQNVASMIAPGVKFVAQPYYKLVQEHGDNAVAGVKDIVNDIKTIAGTPKDAVTPEATPVVTSAGGVGYQYIQQALDSASKGITAIAGAPVAGLVGTGMSFMTGDTFRSVASGGTSIAQQIMQQAQEAATRNAAENTTPAVRDTAPAFASGPQ